MANTHPLASDRFTALVITLNLSALTSLDIGIEGENFRALVHEIRESLASHYLSNTTMYGGEIVLLPGFGNPNSF